MADVIVEGEVDVVGVKGEVRFAAEQADVFAVWGQHVKIAPQGHIAHGGRDMLSAFDLLPRAVADAVIALKIHLRRNGIYGLSAVGCAG